MSEACGQHVVLAGEFQGLMSSQDRRQDIVVTVLFTQETACSQVGKENICGRQWFSVRPSNARHIHPESDQSGAKAEHRTLRTLGKPRA